MNKEMRLKDKLIMTEHLIRADPNKAKDLLTKLHKDFRDEYSKIREQSDRNMDADYIQLKKRFYYLGDLFCPGLFMGADRIKNLAEFLMDMEPNGCDEKKTGNDQRPEES